MEVRRQKRTMKKVTRSEYTLIFFSLERHEIDEEKIILYLKFDNLTDSFSSKVMAHEVISFTFRLT